MRALEPVIDNVKYIYKLPKKSILYWLCSTIWWGIQTGNMLYECHFLEKYLSLMRSWACRYSPYSMLPLHWHHLTLENVIILPRLDLAFLKMNLTRLTRETSRYLISWDHNQNISNEACIEAMVIGHKTIRMRKGSLYLNIVSAPARLQEIQLQISGHYEW
jgi:hypothetical protein